ncbi:uncharacterized protein LOC117648168 [Thrips palmi]|uniref:Uncharacterized protein LOC117648168 n=1 Tax=Thrips palmi TaxID=161013 RepID=A0A6P8ZCG5_THRPL|nr:uncharacterized protein LOC117648168 [Thrips palmi]
MICSVCMEQFDSAERRPKVLPCGHSYCLKCLIQLPSKKCPVDSKAFNLPPEKLLDNYSLLAESNKPAEKADPRFWCLSCKKAATADCIDDHPVCSLKKARAKDAALLLGSLQRGEAALDELRDTLEHVARELQDSRDRLQQDKAGLAAARARLQDAQVADEAVWEQAKAAAREGLSRTPVRLLDDLADPVATCSLTVQRGADGGVAWRGEVGLADDAAARLLLCRMALNGGLQQEQQQEHEEGQERPAARLLPERCNEGENVLTLEDMKARMVEGARVERGRDWPEGRYEDGKPPGPGTVIPAISSGNSGWVSVKWDRTGVTSSHPMGEYQKTPTQRGYDPVTITEYQLHLLAPAPLKSHLGTTSTFGAVSTSTVMAQVLTNGILKTVRVINLDCSVSPYWNQKVLEQVAPHLEGLQMSSPQQRHLDVVRTMPYLKALCLSGVTGDHLQQLNQIPILESLCIKGVTGDALQAANQMASLRRLELHCPFAAPLPVVAFPATPAKLQWLRCGVYPLAAALALVRAHADSLQELQLVAASTEPYGCPDLADEIRRCGLKQLMRMVLLRQTDGGAFCRHDKDSCRVQKIQLWDMFVEANLTAVKVICSECDREEF